MSDLWVLRDVGPEWEIERPATVEDVRGWLQRHRVASPLVRRLFETHQDAQSGDEINSAHYDLAADLRDAWLQRFGRDIEEDLGLSGYAVTRLCDVALDVLRDWEYPPTEEERDEFEEQG